MKIHHLPIVGLIFLACTAQASRLEAIETFSKADELNALSDTVDSILAKGVFGSYGFTAKHFVRRKSKGQSNLDLARHSIYQATLERSVSLESEIPQQVVIEPIPRVDLRPELGTRLLFVSLFGSNDSRHEDYRDIESSNAANEFNASAMAFLKYSEKVTDVEVFKGTMTNKFGFLRLLVIYNPEFKQILVLTSGFMKYR